jgi:hypothetical protein
MNDGIEAFRLQLQKELGLSIGPKDPLLALWVSQKELLEQNAVIGSSRLCSQVATSTLSLAEVSGTPSIKRSVDSRTVTT